jgi:hypothetical protein
MQERNEIPQIILGSFCIIVINAVIWGIAFLLATRTYPSSFFIIGLWVAVGIGLVQLIYVIPAIVLLRRRRQFALRKGVIIGAVLTALFNGGCFLIPYLLR